MGFKPRTILTLRGILEGGGDAEGGPILRDPLPPSLKWVRDWENLAKLVGILKTQIALKRGFHPIQTEPESKFLMG